MDKIKEQTGSPYQEHRETWNALLSEYINKRLPPVQRFNVERHLEECPECREELNGLYQTVQALQALPKIKPPRSFEITARQARSLRPRPLYRAAQFAAAVAAVFLLLSCILNFSAELEQQNLRVEGVVSPTLEVPVVGTRAPGTPCPSNGQVCTFGGLGANLNPVLPDSPTPVAVPPRSLNNFGRASFQFVQVGLLVLVVLTSTLAFALRPRAPNRVKSKS